MGSARGRRRTPSLGGGRVERERRFPSALGHGGGSGGRRTPCREHEARRGTRRRGRKPARILSILPRAGGGAWQGGRGGLVPCGKGMGAEAEAVGKEPFLPPLPHFGLPWVRGVLRSAWGELVEEAPPGRLLRAYSRLVEVALYCNTGYLAPRRSSRELGEAVPLMVGRLVEAGWENLPLGERVWAALGSSYLMAKPEALGLGRWQILLGGARLLSPPPWVREATAYAVAVALKGAEDPGVPRAGGGAGRPSTGRERWGPGVKEGRPPGTGGLGSIL